MTICRSGFLLPLVLLGLLWGCAARTPAPVVDHGRHQPALLIPPSLDSGFIPKTGLKTTAASTLLMEAQARMGSGDMESAAQILERTLRIEPRNPLLWSELAFVRSRQGRWALAEQLAMKSNALARNDTQLQAHNWSLIAAVRRQQGDEPAAQRAEQRLRNLGLP